MKNKELKQGDKVTTIYGKIETVLVVTDSQVITYESIGCWYHPTKVFKIN